MLGGMGLGEARDLLAEVFGHADFRFGQREAMEAACAGRDALILLPTGSGKSLCYQLPALMAQRRGLGTCLVISPLIALMHDQVAALQARGLRAAALHSQQAAAGQRETLAALRTGELALLYVSPERAAQSGFRRVLRGCRIALLAVDEAHCVSQWGHDFRPDYLRIHELRGLFDAPCLALTATATPRVMEEIAKLLALRNPQVVTGTFSRPNLAFAVRQPGAQAQRLAALEKELEAAELGRRGKGGRGIIYCSTRKSAETVAKALRARGFAITHYHAGRTQLARERAHNAFESARTPLLAATNAFGMGIDLPDIRLIVHFQAPGSLEAYYQEAGRAGRDGDPARCVLFFGAGDLTTQRRLATASAGSAGLLAHRERSIEGVARYANEIRCRQQMLCAHFSGGKEHPACGGCDVCVDSESVEASQACETERAVDIQALPLEAREIIVEAVARLRRPVGRSNLARALRGSHAKSLSRGGLLSLPEYGKLGDYDERSVVAAIDALLAEGRLEHRGRKYPTVWIPGKAIRTRTTGSGDGNANASERKISRSRGGALARALDNYRRRTARNLKWKTYMVFQKRVILAIDREEPASHDALARIPGLGPAKIERFGDDILQLVREHGGRR